jgi:hypothetical protein
MFLIPFHVSMNSDDRRLDAAVSLGIITAEQAAGIRALTPERRTVQLPRPVDASTIGYVLGAITVLIAMGWFLADRWDWLGAGGVLAVVALYIGMFLVVAQRLRREGYETAGGFAVLLAVAMVPIAVIALNELTHWISTQIPSRCHNTRFSEVFDFDLWDCRGLELVVELTTLAAALLALRAVKFSLLVVPIAVIALRFVFHAVAAVFAGELGPVTAGWVWVIGASLVTAAAYQTDRAQPDEHDYALWLHVIAVIAAATASVMVLNATDGFRHLLPAGAALAFVFSLRMRRAPWTLLGIGWFVSYLGWLAADVFRNTPVFPIVLAALGLGVIIATVWVQRNAAMLVARFGGISTDERPTFPGGVGLLLLPVLAAMIQLPAAVQLDAAERRGRLSTMERNRLRNEREPAISADSARLDSLRQAAQTQMQKETPPPQVP